MNQQNAHLLTLIKLREGHLSDAEGVSVREQLASDSLLLQQWKQLSHLYDNSMVTAELIETDEFDSELIAAFIEERMSLEQRDTFESSCWKNKAALREVISVYQAAHVDSFSSDIPEEFRQCSAQASKRMLDFASQQCDQADLAQMTSKYLQKIEDSQRSDRNVNSLDPSKIEVHEESSRTLSQKINSKHQSIQENRGNQRKQNWFLVTAVLAVIVIAFPVYLLLVQNNKTATITEKTIPEQSPLVTKPLLPGVKAPLKIEEAPKLAKKPEMRKEADASPDDPGTIPKTPVMDKEDNEKPLIAKKGVPEESEVSVDIQITWERISGIVGYRTDRNSPWKGILSGVSAKKMNLGKHLEFHTLPLSWLQGKIVSGLEVVIDADTEIQIAIQGVKQQGKSQQSKSDSAEMPISIDLELSTGKAAFSHLQSGDLLHFRDHRQEWQIEVIQDDTSIGFIQKAENSREIMTFSGAIQITSSATQQKILLKGHQKVALSNQDFSVPLKVTQKQRWRTRPPKTAKLNKAFVKQMNQSGNLLEALLSNSPIGIGNNLLISTNLGFSLDPIDSVPEAASSQSEIQRVAAINWLVATAESLTTRAVWKQIETDINAKQSALSVRDWFKVAQGKAPKSQNLLRELSAGLGAKQSLFVRQCSIYFLRQFTRLRLSEYDPNQPSTVAINSVLQKVRRATGNNNRRRP